MKLQKRMIFVFSVLIFVTSMIFGVIYFVIIRNHYIDTQTGSLMTAADNYSRQFVYMVEQMEEITQNILADEDTLEAIFTLSRAEDGKNDTTYYYTSAKNSIKTTLNRDSYKKNYNRVVLFMQNGAVVSGTNYKYNPVDADADISRITWLGKIEGNRGKCVLLPVHKDDWCMEDSNMVLSVVKEILGENLGFLEVQKNVADIDLQFVPGNRAWNLYIYRNDTLLYSSDSNYKPDVQEAINDFISSPDEGEYVCNKEGRILAISRPYSSGIRTVITDNTNVSIEAMKAALPLTLLIVFLTELLSFIYIYAMSHHMVKPIRLLKQQMENTDINNLKLRNSIEINDEEIGKLYQSYQNVLVGLKQSIQKERLLSELQKKAQFDLLQAQVNPHFLFNVLNVISSRGMEAGDEVICDICADLAQMLRYSTDVREKQAKLEEELHYLELYLNLLKFRYEDRLEYEISTSPCLYSLEIPKMVLQQIVENSISHGYRNVDRIRQIKITGKGTAESWVIQVTDNGVGISETARQEIYRKCAEIRDALSEKRSHVEMAIGGMGLVNTYARLYQIYGKKFYMEIRSSSEGTEVSIGVN